MITPLREPQWTPCLRGIMWPLSHKRAQRNTEALRQPRNVQFHSTHLCALCCNSACFASKTKP